MNRYNYDMDGRLVVHQSGGRDKKIYKDAIDLIKELDAIIYVYENTTFAHWYERALNAEAELARGK
jgi:hypothetical protein